MSKLPILLEYVANKNIFYKDIIKKYDISNPYEIERYPVITRKMLQEYRYNMFSDGYSTKYFHQELHRQFSSGSSGIPVSTYWDYKDWYLSNLVLWRKRLKWYDIHPTEKCVMFTLHAFNMSSEKSISIENKNILMVNVSLIHDQTKYEELLVIIEKFNPKWFYVQPSVLRNLLYAYKRLNKRMPKELKYIEVTGELLSFDLRKNVEDFVGVPIASMYGSEEMNGIAYECPYHKMHILSENVLVECCNDNGIQSEGKGEAIVTNLNNLAMPLIRYNQGDIITIKREEDICLCGEHSFVIDNIHGRKLDSIYLKNNFEISTLMLMEVIAEVNNRYNDIIVYYKYEYYKSKNVLLCYIKVKNESWFDNVRSALKNVFVSKLMRNDVINFEIEKYCNDIECGSKLKIVEMKE